MKRVLPGTWTQLTGFVLMTAAWLMHSGWLAAGFAFVGAALVLGMLVYDAVQVVKDRRIGRKRTHDYLNGTTLTCTCPTTCDNPTTPHVSCCGSCDWPSKEYTG